MITLAENEEYLVEALRTLPADVTDHVVTWVARLQDLGNGRIVEWSDEWSAEDLADATKASLAAFDDGNDDGESRKARGLATL